MKPQLNVALMLLAGFGLLACTVDPKLGQDGHKVTKTAVYNGIDFGVDGSEWANDHECDDPRFKGVGMTDTELLNKDARMDATDCLLAFKAGNLTLI